MTRISLRNTKALRHGACAAHVARAVSGLALCALLCGAPVHAANVTVDGRAVYNTFVENGRTYVPLRALFEGMGWEVGWDAGTRCATIAGAGCTYEIRENAYGLSGTSDIASDVPNVNRGGKLYIPIRAAAKALDGAVAYHRGSVTVETPANSAPAGMPDTGAFYSEDDLYWLSRIIEAEAGGEPMEGKIAVGNTILNRVASGDYPNTIYGVIFDKQWGTQYTPTSNGTIYNTPSADSVEAARRCLSGENLVGDCLFFLNPDIAKSFWIVNNRTFYCSIGDHDFYL